MTPVTRLHQGRADQAEAFVAWPAPDFWSDPDRTRRLTMAGQVLELRLVSKIRIAQGATYSPSAGAMASDTYPGYGMVYAGVEIPPAKLAGFFTDVDAIAAAMRTQGITADELLRASRPRIESIQKAQQTNSYWLAMLHLAQTEPRRLTLIRDSIPDYQQMTVDQVNAAARDYLLPDKAWRYEVEPTKALSDAAPTGPAAAGG